MSMTYEEMRKLPYEEYRKQWEAMPVIPLTECKHGYLYHISSRNLGLGVFNEKTQGFVGIREKFYHEYLFTEYHWDIGAPFGTVNPKVLLDQCPIEDLQESHLVEVDGEKMYRDNQPLLNWLLQRSVELGHRSSTKLMQDEEKDV